MRRLLLALVLAACTPTPQAAAPSPSGYRAVVVAGDASIDAFDNAANRLARDLATRAGIAPADMKRLSARPRRPAGVALATPANVLDAIATMRPGAGKGCLVFVTAHGERGEGLYLPAGGDDMFLDPARLDRALAQGCGEAPTVVVMSGCYSGIFTRPPMTRGNRMILTAARSDRPSFGCSIDDQFTEFDNCLLGTLENAAGPWSAIYDATRRCVGLRERALNVQPSEPQAWFAPSMSALPPPWRNP